MASISLPALHTETQQASPLAMYTQLQQIRNAQAQNTALTQENQQRQLALQDQMTLRSIAPNHVIKDADGNVKGFDTEGFLNEAAGKQVNPATLNQMRIQYATATKDLASASETVRNNEIAKNKQMYEVLEGVRSAKDRSAALAGALPQLQKLGIDPSKLPQNPSDDDINNFEAGIGMHAQALADAKTVADTAKAQQETATSKTTQAHTQMEINQGGPPATRELNDWLAKHPGKGPSDYEEYMKKLVPAFNFNLAANTGAGAGKSSSDIAKQFGMTPEAFDQAAEKYYQTGNMPQMGRNAQGMALQRAVMNRTAELHPGASLAEGSAEYAANKESLKKLQSNFDAVSAFENTALKNIQLFRDQAKKVIDTGIPLLNAPLRGAAKMLGSQDQAGFETALQVANNEIAKVTSSPGLTGVLSDSARKEVEAYNPKDATVGQAMHVADILTQDMANRHQSYQQQIQDIQKRMEGSGGGSSAKPLTAAQITQIAKDNKVSEDEVRRQAKAKGVPVE